RAAGAAPGAGRAAPAGARPAPGPFAAAGAAPVPAPGPGVLPAARSPPAARPGPFDAAGAAPRPDPDPFAAAGRAAGGAEPLCGAGLPGRLVAGRSVRRSFGVRAMAVSSITGLAGRPRAASHPHSSPSVLQIECPGRGPGRPPPASLSAAFPADSRAGGGQRAARPATLLDSGPGPAHADNVSRPDGLC